MTTVELGRVRPLCKCGHGYRDHEFAPGLQCEDCYCDRYTPPQDWPRVRTPGSAAPRLFGFPADAPSPRPVVAQLLADVAAVIARRRQECYGSIVVTDAQVDELSRAIVATLTATYRIEENT